MKIAVFEHFTALPQGAPVLVAGRGGRGARPGGLVLTPRAGCGGRVAGAGPRRRQVAAALDVGRRAARRDDLLAQEYVPGRPVSVSLVVSARTLDLGLNRQRLRAGPTLAYLGGETFWPHARAGEALAAARAAVEALPDSCRGVRGYLGVDLV